MWPQWTSMLSTWQWLALSAVPPAIVALYFLKLRRQPLEVPSTYLWRKAIEEMHVNSLWQRLRRSMLLALQLLLLALLFVALLNPSWQGTKFSGDRFIFLVDNSASMSATDLDRTGKTSRLELAKRRVEQLIDGMKSGDKAMIISFSDTAEVVEPYTTNVHELRRRLAAIRPTERTTSLSEALRLASGLANAGRGGEKHAAAVAPGGTPITRQKAAPAAEAFSANLVVLSDFKFPDVADFPLGNLAPKFEIIGAPDASNVAILAFSARGYEDRPREYEAIARLGNFSSQEKTVTVELYRDGRQIDSREAHLAPGEQKTLPAFPLTDMERGVLELRLDAEDDLALDNRAYAVVRPPRRGRVLYVTPGDEPLKRALGTSKARELAEVQEEPPAFLKTARYAQAADAGVYDLVIYDQCAPQRMPQANTFFVGRLPPDGRWRSGATISDPRIIDSARTHPLVQWVEVGDFLIAEARVLQPPSGSAPLFEAPEGPIFAIGPREGFEDAVLGFEIFTTDATGHAQANTDWPRRASFPVFVHGLLTYLGGGSERVETDSLRPGQPLAVKSLLAAEAASVLTPSGRKLSVSPDRHQMLYFAGTEEVGLYEIRQGKLPARRFAVNLFSAAESDIRPLSKHSVKIGDADVPTGTDWEVVRRAIWKPLVLLALAVLLLEWYIYNRRVYL